MAIFGHFDPFLAKKGVKMAIFGQKRAKNGHFGGPRLKKGRLYGGSLPKMAQSA